MSEDKDPLALNLENSSSKDDMIHRITRITYPYTLIKNACIHDKHAF